MRALIQHTSLVDPTDMPRLDHGADKCPTCPITGVDEHRRPISKVRSPAPPAGWQAADSNTEASYVRKNTNELGV